MSAIRLAVTGGRDYHLTEDDKALLRSLLLWTDVLVHGAARGADSECAEVAEELGVAVDPFPADWKRHGQKAGYIRNINMLRSSIDILLAFPGGKGTSHTRQFAKVFKIPVLDAKGAQLHPETYWEYVNLPGASL